MALRSGAGIGHDGPWSRMAIGDRDSQPEVGRMDEEVPGQELEEIGEDECFALLCTQSLGRLAVVRDGRPEIFPVNYALDGHTITIRTGPGSKLTYPSLAHVAFDVEDIDRATREGWVVEVRGFAEEITDTGDR